MTDTPPDEVLIEAARRLGWTNMTIEHLREMYRDPYPYVRGKAFRAMADTLVELGWKPPVDPLLAEADAIAAQIARDRGLLEIAHQHETGRLRDHEVFEAALAGLRRRLEMNND